MSGKPKHISIFSSAVARPAKETTWQPATDIYKTRDGWLLKLELAGIRLSDIAITASGAVVTVTGIRRDQVSDQNCCQYSMEINYSRFKRMIHLPGEVSSAVIETHYENGILLVHVRA